MFVKYNIPTSKYNIDPYPYTLFNFHILLFKYNLPTILLIKNVGLLGRNVPSIYIIC